MNLLWIIVWASHLLNHGVVWSIVHVQLKRRVGLWWTQKNSGIGRQKNGKIVIFNFKIITKLQARTALREELQSFKDPWWFSCFMMFFWGANLTTRKIQNENWEFRNWHLKPWVVLHGCEMMFISSFSANWFILSISSTRTQDPSVKYCSNERI